MSIEIMAIIPARGGSKSIKKKNIAPLNGKPLISYILHAAKNSKYINRIIVSTDDQEIAEVSEKYGADIPFLRPKEYAEDDSSTMDVLFHAAKWLNENEKYRPDIIILLQATSPFTKTEQIDNAIDKLMRDKTATAVTTVIEVEHNYHPYNIRQIQKDGSVTFVLPEEHDKYPTRQAKPKYYAFGNCYAFRYTTLVDNRSIYGDNCLPLVVDAASALDINEPHDLVIAETIMKQNAIDAK